MLLGAEFTITTHHRIGLEVLLGFGLAALLLAPDPWLALAATLLPLPGPPAAGTYFVAKLGSLGMTLFSHWDHLWI